MSNLTGYSDQELVEELRKRKAIERKQDLSDEIMDDKDLNAAFRLIKDFGINYQVLHDVNISVMATVQAGLSLKFNKLEFVELDEIEADLGSIDIAYNKKNEEAIKRVFKTVCAKDIKNELKKLNELLERLYKKYPKDKQQILSHLKHIM